MSLRSSCSNLHSRSYNWDRGTTVWHCYRLLHFFKLFIIFITCQLFVSCLRRQYCSRKTACSMHDWLLKKEKKEIVPLLLCQNYDAGIRNGSCIGFRVPVWSLLVPFFCYAPCNLGIHHKYCVCVIIFWYASCFFIMYQCINEITDVNYRWCLTFKHSFQEYRQEPKAL